MLSMNQCGPITVLVSVASFESTKKLIGTLILLTLDVGKFVKLIVAHQSCAMRINFIRILDV